MCVMVPGCDANCPLEKFVDLMKPHMYQGSVDEWREECDMEDASNGGYCVYRQKGEEKRNLADSVYTERKDRVSE